jgi:hypothetical protein
MKVSKAKPKNQIVSTGKMPDVHAKVDDTAGGFHGPGLNQKKPFTDYSKKKGK